MKTMRALNGWARVLLHDSTGQGVEIALSELPHEVARGIRYHARRQERYRGRNVVLHPTHKAYRLAAIECIAKYRLTHG